MKITNPAREIDKLRAAGYRVKVQQLRRDRTRRGESSGLLLSKHLLSYPPLAKGGETRVVIDGLGKRPAVGLAFCSDKDNFNRKTGLRIALGRALAGRDDITGGL